MPGGGGLLEHYFPIPPVESPYDSVLAPADHRHWPCHCEDVEQHGRRLAPHWYAERTFTLKPYGRCCYLWNRNFDNQPISPAPARRSQRAPGSHHFSPIGTGAADDGVASDPASVAMVNPNDLGFVLLEDNERHPSAPPPKRLSTVRERCDCKRRGSDCRGTDCYNRAMRQECSSSTCSLHKEDCKNRCFQSRAWRNVEVRRSFPNCAFRTRAPSVTLRTITSCRRLLPLALRSEPRGRRATGCSPPRTLTTRPLSSSITARCE